MRFMSPPLLNGSFRRHLPAKTSTTTGGSKYSARPLNLGYVSAPLQTALREFPLRPEKTARFNRRGVTIAKCGKLCGRHRVPKHRPDERAAFCRIRTSGRSRPAGTRLLAGPGSLRPSANVARPTENPVGASAVGDDSCVPRTAVSAALDSVAGVPVAFPAPRTASRHWPAGRQ
jgi:hypothetical protein